MKYDEPDAETCVFQDLQRNASDKIIYNILYCNHMHQFQYIEQKCLDIGVFFEPNQIILLSREV